VQQTIEGWQLVRDIEERGYAEFEHHISPDTIDNLINRYANFTLSHPDPLPSTMNAMLPDSDDATDMSHRLDELDRSADTQDEWHKYRTNTQQVGKPDGYTNRSFQEKALKQARGLILPPEDPKEFYHFTPRHYGAMSRNHQEYDWGSIPSEVSDLNNAFAAIHAKASELIVRICGIVEETHPEIRKFVTAESLRTSPIRLLFYHPSNGDSLGAGHYDKGAMTLQLAESHRGLRVAPGNEAPLEEVVRTAENAAFFPGTAIDEHHTPGSPYQPGWHDIVKTDILNDGRSIPSKASEVCARWAIIFFANYENFRQPNKADTHTR